MGQMFRVWCPIIIHGMSTENDAFVVLFRQGQASYMMMEKHVQSRQQC